MKTETSRNLEQYVDHDVLDQSGNKIGTLQCLWSDTQGEPSYLGIQTGWLFGKTHVVPADRAEVNDNLRAIRLPFTAQKVKDAPCYEPGFEMNAAAETELRGYYGATQSSARSAPPAPAAPGRNQEAATVQLREEQLKVGKRQVEAGGVRLRKIVRTETVNQPVQLQREEIVVERVPGRQDGQACQPGAKDFQSEDIYIPLRREEAVVQKESRVREEVRVSKKSQTENQTVSTQVRKEDIEVQRSGAGQPPAKSQRAPQNSKSADACSTEAREVLSRNR